MIGHVQQRRVFRGRGGPNDRRLPKHNARRRRPPPREAGPTTSVEHNPQQTGEEDEWSTTEEENDEEQAVQGEQVVNQDDEALEQSPPDAHFLKEVDHFKQRIRNVKYSIQTSTLALNTLSTYQNNVLRAIVNCAMEWRSTLKYHNEKVKGALERGEIKTIAICKACGLSLFELVQQGLQCGPLAGSKPGYFRRCGSETAKMVLKFLDELAPNKEGLLGMFWSEKQADAVEKWKNEASKAIIKDAEPSKHVKKKMHEAAKKRGHK